MKKTVIAVIVLLGAIACKKNNDGISPNALVGSWRYKTSIIDSGNNRTTTGYDPSVGADLGDTLRFKAPDTVYYTFNGSTTWSNYTTRGDQLILIGSAVRDTLQLRNVSGTQLEMGLPTNNSSINHWMVFEKFNP